MGKFLNIKGEMKSMRIFFTFLIISILITVAAIVFA